jgi:hypothetical protein
MTRINDVHDQLGVVGYNVDAKDLVVLTINGLT